MKLLSLWYQDSLDSYPYWYWLLTPFMWIFKFVSFIRRELYVRGFFKRYKVSVPVIVVGNITVGGNGKTPLCILLAQLYLEKGRLPGILSRGYGGTQRTFPHLVNTADDSRLVGDEPKLMSLRLGGVPVVIDPNRVRGARFLSEQCGCDVIICDDGLQHYQLQRDAEIVVMDNRAFGNERLLPLGPLREGIWRINAVDALVHNIGTNILNHNHRSKMAKGKLSSVSQTHLMQLIPTHWVNIKTRQKKSMTNFSEYINQQKEPVTALAGIGDPKRFFDTLNHIEISVQSTISFKDHHHFTKKDIPSGIVLMTEKDAIKCDSFCSDKHWYLQISADIDSSLINILDKAIADKNG